MVVDVNTYSMREIKVKTQKQTKTKQKTKTIKTKQSKTKHIINQFTILKNL